MWYILIVDDEPNLVDGLSHTLLESFNDDIDISKAYSGKEALEILTESPIDLVITDIRMPGVSGIELIQQIQERRINCRVLILTGYDEFTVIHEAVKLPILAGFLLKNEGDEIIVSKVREVLSDIEQDERNRVTLAQSGKNVWDILLRERMLWDLLGFSPADSGEAPYKTSLRIDLTKPSLLVAAKLLAGEIGNDTMMQLEQFTSIMYKVNFSVETTMLGRGEIVWILQMLSTREGQFPFRSQSELSRYLRSGMHETQSKMLTYGIEISAALSSTWIMPPDLRSQMAVLRDVLKRLSTGNWQQVVDIATDGDMLSQPTDVIAAVQSHIAENLSSHVLSLTHIAAAVNYNPSYLSRMYKNITGENLMDYINNKRIELACKLLSDPAAKIGEISKKAGFASPSYFIMFFKKRMAMTPKEYREKAKQNL